MFLLTSPLHISHNFNYFEKCHALYIGKCFVFKNRVLLTIQKWRRIFVNCKVQSCNHDDTHHHMHLIICIYNLLNAALSSACMFCHAYLFPHNMCDNYMWHVLAWRGIQHLDYQLLYILHVSRCNHYVSFPVVAGKVAWSCFWSFATIPWAWFSYTMANGAWGRLFSISTLSYTCSSRFPPAYPSPGTLHSLL